MGLCFGTPAQDPRPLSTATATSPGTTICLFPQPQKLTSLHTSTSQLGLVLVFFFLNQNFNFYCSISTGFLFLFLIQKCPIIAMLFFFFFFWLKSWGNFPFHLSWVVFYISTKSSLFLMLDLNRISVSFTCSINFSSVENLRVFGKLESCRKREYLV